MSGYHFHFIQSLIPETDALGHALKFFPQKKKRGRKLHKFGSGAFCRFHIDAPNVSGVYLWVLDNQILYIGRTKHLAQRFNNGYGKISVSNCYIGGTITNCRMNKVLLELFEQGKVISLYFYKTRKYKVVERSLLRAIRTPYNIKVKNPVIMNDVNFIPKYLDLRDRCFIVNLKKQYENTRKRESEMEETFTESCDKILGVFPGKC